MARRLTSVGGTVLMVVGPALAIAALHRLGSLPWIQVDWSDVPGWLDRATLEEAIAATVRLIALTAAYWLTSSTVLYLAASLSRVPALVRAAGAVTLPLSRRLVDGVAMTTIAFSSMAAPMVAASMTADAAPAPTMTVIPPQQVVPTQSPTTTTLSDHPPVPVAPDLPIDPTSHPPRPAPQPAVDDHLEVVSGDNLWNVSKRHLAALTGRTPSDAEIHRYWRRVIDLNLGRLRSGDPDLIYPGEVIFMPEE
jgi:hypothetical protein